MKLFTWYEYPEDVLDMADMLIAYLLPRAPVRAQRAPGGRRPHYKMATRRAYQLLNMQARTKRYGGILHWSLSVKWRDRLELAGVDPETLQVKDALRWALAWKQLSLTNKFFAGVQRISIANNKTAPIPEPIERTLARPTKDTAGLPKPRAGQDDEPAADESPYTTFMRRNIRSVLNRQG